MQVATNGVASVTVFLAVHLAEGRPSRRVKNVSNVAQRFPQGLIAAKLTVRELVSSPGHSPRYVVTGADVDLIYPELFAASPHHAISVEAAEKVIGGEAEQFGCFNFWHLDPRELAELPLAC